MQQNEPHTFSFRFSLTYEEAREAFLLIIDRRTPAARRIMSFTLLALAVICVCLYGLHPYGLQYALTALLFAVSSYLVSAYPSLRAARAAKNVTRTTGIYEFALSEAGCLLLPNGERIDLNGDSGSRAYETEHLFAIRPDRLHTFCLPKHSIPASDFQQVRSILKTNVRAYHDRRRVLYK